MHLLISASHACKARLHFLGSSYGMFYMDFVLEKSWGRKENSCCGIYILVLTLLPVPSTRPQQHRETDELFRAGTKLIVVATDETKHAVQLTTLGHAPPALRLLMISPKKRISGWILAVSPHKIYPILHSIIHELRPLHILRCTTPLYPLDHRCKDIMLRIERNTSLRRVPTLTQHPCTRTSTAMEHT